MNIFGLHLDPSSFLAGIAATGVGSLLGALIINKLLLGDMVVNYVANHIDDIVDNAQRKDTAMGRALRNRLIVMADKIIKELNAPDGTN